jgi:hypothetical protein
MIRVDRAPKPPDFDERVHQPGRRWLEKNDKGNTPGYWRRATRDLRRAFHDRCGYSAMWLSTPGTVDHFVSRDEDRSLAYEWTNLRYAASWINCSKGKLRSDQVLDPFEVGDDWFEIKLPQCEMFVTERCPASHRDRATTMLVRFELGKGADIVEYRQEWYRMYEEGELTLDGLERKAPLIARAIRKARGQAGGA